MRNNLLEGTMFTPPGVCSLISTFAGGMLGGSTASVVASYDIPFACRFNLADNAELNRIPAGAGSLVKWTWSAWLKRGNITTGDTLFGADHDGTGDNFDIIQINAAGQFIFQQNNAGGTIVKQISAALLRDPAAWYHLVVIWDTAQGAAADRCKMYINNVRITDWLTNTQPSASLASKINAAKVHRIGVLPYFAVAFLDGYLSDQYFINNQALDPTSFGEVSTTTGQWTPIDASELTFGTNGFRLDFADSANLGNDVSGNNNDWTSSGLTTADQVTDTPTNNYWMLSPLIAISGGSLKDGNLVMNAGTAVAHKTASASPLPLTGKWYWEVTANASANNMDIGIQNINTNPQNVATGGEIGGRVEDYVYRSDGTKKNSGTPVSTGYATYTNGDIIGIAWDADNREIYFAKNNVWQDSGDPVARTNPAFSAITSIPTHSPAISVAETTDTTFNFGQSGFTYAPPAGFLALNTTNLPTPAIPDSSAQFQATLYTGNATGSRAIAQSGNSQFGPDLVFIKNRDQADEWKVLDTIRGATKELNTDSTNAESTDANGLTAFSTTDGFTLGTGAGGYNDNAENFVAYQWQEGVTPGFDIVSYTGNGSARTIVHNLGVVPDLVIVKERTNDVGSWYVYHSANTVAPETDYLALDTTAATVDLNTVWNDTAPTSSVFSVGTLDDVNGSSDTYIAYLFAAVEGFSAFGSYVGNGSVDGPFINLGFKPAVVLVKQTNTFNDWVFMDASRSPANFSTAAWIHPDLPNAESNGSNPVDLLSNGFKPRYSGATYNANGGTYIYMAWAESPFKTATAR